MGALLRAVGLDELPQLLNVVRGEMSLVGPRPCIPYEYENYEPAHRRRFNAVPGLTGLWQVSGKNKTTFNQMMELDVKYSREKTLWVDLAIILKTPAVIIGQVLELAQRKRGETMAGMAARPGCRAASFGVGGIEGCTQGSEHLRRIEVCLVRGIRMHIHAEVAAQPRETRRRVRMDHRCGHNPTLAGEPVGEK